MDTLKQVVLFCVGALTGTILALVVIPALGLTLLIGTLILLGLT